MTLRNAYRYVAQVTARDGRRLGELALDPDFGPAAESAHLAGLREGALPASAHHGPGIIEPVFDAERGQPYVGGVRIRFDAAPPDHEAPVLAWRYLQPAVEQAATRLVERGTLQPSETFVYRICAFAAPAAPRAAVHEDENDEPVALALQRVATAELVAGAIRLGEAAWDEDDFPLFVHRAVLAQATHMARAAGECETGGILVGHLRRDRDTPEVHVEITALIPATQARAGRTHLGFTPQTWSAMRDALALRARNEMMLGWFHTHPHWCARCDPAQRKNCVFAQPFFSRDDCALHRTVFDAAFHVALLLSDTGESALHYDFFGWRHGHVAARGCYVLPAPGQDTAPALPRADGARSARILTLSENPHEH